MTLQEAVIATVTYHDIFKYPLKKEEIQKYLIGKKSNLKTVKKTINQLLKKKLIESKTNYIFLKNKTNLEAIRTKREQYSQYKLTRAKLYSKILHLIPTIKGICITGALSMNNCTKNDDLDLLIFCQKHTLWTTRFLVNILMLPFKRSPNNKNIANKACLNIFIDESDLMIKSQNIYTAHEICQMKLLWDKNNNYLRFIKKNNWYLKFLPNWQPQNRGADKNKYTRIQIPILLEELFKKIQTSYMKSKVTSEIIGDSQLFFHPRNTQNIILNKYYQNLKNIQLTTKDKF